MIPSCVVSVSLRSIIHSYLLWILRGTKAQEEFPSPYRVSFILMILAVVTLELDIMYFRLLTEYHSFLYKPTLFVNLKTKEFPSPYGVSFILILVSTATPMISSSTSGFRLLTEYYSFLF